MIIINCMTENVLAAADEIDGGLRDQVAVSLGASTKTKFII